MFFNLFKADNREQTFLSWASIGLLIFVSSFIWSPSRDGLDVVYFLAFFLPIFFILIRRKYKFSEYGGWFTLSALAYAGYATLSSLWGGHEFLFFVLQLIALCVWLCGACWLMCNHGVDLEKLYNTLIVVGCIVSLYTVVSFYNEGYQDGYHLEVRLTCWCSARNSNLIGGVYGVLSLLSYIRLLKSSTKNQFFVYGMSTIILLLPLIFSQSRASIVAYLVVAAIACVVLRPGTKALLIHAALLLPGFLAIILLADITAVFNNRLTGVGERDLIWIEILKQIMENPLFGVGYSLDTKIPIDGVGIFNHAHNAWLDIAYRTGAIGLLLAIVHLLLIFVNIKKDSQSIPLILWLVFGCIYSLFDSRGFFWQIDTKWFFYWVPIGLLTALIVAKKHKYIESVPAELK